MSARTECLGRSARVVWRRLLPIFCAPPSVDIEEELWGGDAQTAVAGVPADPNAEPVPAAAAAEDRERESLKRHREAAKREAAAARNTIPQPW